MDEIQHKFDKFHKRESRLRKITVLLSLIPIIIGAVWMFYAYRQVQDLQDQLVAIESDLDAKQAALNTLESKSVDLQFEIEALREIRNNLDSSLKTRYHLTDADINRLSTTESLRTKLEADSLIKQIKEVYDYKANITIRYYRKSIDDSHILKNLKSLNYNLEIIEPKKYMKDQQTNAIWYGREVPPRDCKIIALTLIRAGTPIKSIEPFSASKKDPNYKADIIEIGGYKKISGRQPLNVQDVRNLEYPYYSE